MLNNSFIERLKWRFFFLQRGFPKKSYAHFLLLLFIVIFFFMLYNFSPNSPKKVKKKNEVSEKLKQKKQEVFELFSDLEQKILNNKDFVQKFEKEINALIIETKREKNRNNISSLSSALGNKRIKNNLLLIGEKKAYIDKVKELTQDMRMAQRELEVIKESIEDDMILAKALSSQGVDSLMLKIDKVINQSTSKFNTTISIENDFKKRSFQGIWEEIEAKK